MDFKAVTNFLIREIKEGPNIKDEYKPDLWFKSVAEILFLVLKNKALKLNLKRHYLRNILTLLLTENTRKNFYFWYNHTNQLPTTPNHYYNQI